MNNQFLLIITIDDFNIITSDVIEIDTNDKFILYYINNSIGEYIGKVKEEYNKILDIIKSCCVKDVFKTEQANLIIKYIKNKYHDDLEFLWNKLPEHAIIRNKINNKWYFTISNIEKKAIGINEKGKIEIIDLLMEPTKISNLIDNKKYFGGYHMNKKHWFTIELDNSIDIKEIYKYIDNSYQISLKQK